MTRTTSTRQGADVPRSPVPLLRILSLLALAAAILGQGQGNLFHSCLADDAPTKPPPAPAAAADEGLRSLAEHALKCTVGISCKKGDYQAYTGTGAVITPDGHILTSTTVVPSGAEKIEVVFPDFVVRTGTLVEANEGLEATIIKVEAENLPCLAIARELPAVGDRAYTTSNANDVLRKTGVASFSTGGISGLYRVDNLGGESLYSGLAVETTAAVNPGTDGGPIVNDAGQICGIVSLNVSPARWQGVGVPAKVLLEQLESLKSGKLALRFDPLATHPAAHNPAATLARHAGDLQPFLVGIHVQRKFAPEVLPRTQWDDYRRQIAEFDQKPLLERSLLLQEFYAFARVAEANQMLRRPKDPVTGLVVSPDGHVLTSDFNLGEDAVFLDKKTGGPRTFALDGKLADLLKEPEGGYDRGTNPVEKITVTLADGGQHEAEVVGRHILLGIALLKIEKSDLPFCDVAKRSGSPRLGAAVGIVGRVEGADAPFTLNAGIVSSERRNRGFQWQTDALLNYGNSGGPVLDENGKFLGLATAPIEPRTVMGRIFRGLEMNAWSMAPNSGVGMIARGDRIAEQLEKLKAGESTLVIPGAYLGVGPDPTRVLGAEVVVGNVSADSPAGKAGLQRGDRLLAINGEELGTWKDLTDHLMEFKPGDKVELKVRRPGIVKKLVVNGKSVTNDAELQELIKSLKPNEKFEGTMASEDTKLMPVILGERK